MAARVLPHKIILPTVYGSSFYEINRIISFSATNKVCTMTYLELSHQMQEVVIQRRLKALENSLANHGFLLIRRDSLINTAFIQTVKKDRTILLSNGQVYHIARERYEDVKSYFAENFTIV